MSTPSYVGVLDPDGRTYHARYAHFDGGPDTMPYMIAAVWWHTFGRDGTATGQALLAHTCLVDRTTERHAACPGQAHGLRPVGLRQSNGRRPHGPERRARSRHRV